MFPQKFTSSVSHWQATNRGPNALWNHGAKDDLPTEVVDYAIIGGGMTGASLAYQLTRPGSAGDGKKVILLEAKDIASGATGRNGGHIAPAYSYIFSGLVKPLAKRGVGLTNDDALAVISNEQDTLRYAEELIKAEGLDVDFWKGSKLEVFCSESEVEAARKALAAYEEARQSSDRWRDLDMGYELIDDPVEAKKVARSSSALAVLRAAAATCHPHKLATALVRLVLASETDFKYFSWAPVKSFDSMQDGCRVIDCHDRGNILARQVIVCTNAYTQYLFPKGEDTIASHIVPYRGHAANIIPPTSHSGPGAITFSGEVEDNPYFMCTPHNGIVTGVGGMTSVNAGLLTKSDVYEQDDDSVIFDSFRGYFSKFFKGHFDGWADEIPGEGLNRLWSGIMASSRDKLPLIGRVPNEPNLWAAVAFHGHGMARILTCTRSLASQLKTGQWDDRLPRPFEITPERLKRAKLAPRVHEEDEVGQLAETVKRVV